MGIDKPVVAVVLLLLVAAITSSEEDRWSRLATAERRQGDWVPLTCANCRPVSLVDQGAQGSNSLPSVLTPPPRVEEARLLPPPPPPPDGLFQTAATGFLQQYTQQQPPPPPRKPLQFLQETSPSINRPQAQFLKSNFPLNQKQPQGILQEPSSDFQPPQQTQTGIQTFNRQPQLINFNQQLLPEQPYLNQPLFLGPQFVAAPFFPQTSIPPQNVQQINPVQVQQQSPLSPNVLPANNQHFQVPADRPVFVQQITAASPEPPIIPQQAPSQPTVSQDQYLTNGTSNEKNEGEREEVQLLYVPVETLNQRARNLGKQKSLPSNQGVAAQTVGTESNTFTSPGQNIAFSTRKPHFEDQTSFNTQLHTSKHQHVKQQFQQQLPPEDQEKYNSQIHTVREQFNINQGDKFLQQPLLKNQENFRLETQNTKQYSNKPAGQFQSQFQQDQSFTSQFNTQQQNAQFQQVTNEGLKNFQHQPQGVNQHPNNQHDNFNHNIQQDPANFNGQSLNSNQQFAAQLHSNNFQQQPVQHQQQQITNSQGLTRQQFNQQIANQNQPFLQQQHLQLNQQTLTSPGKEQPYVNQPIQLNPIQPQLQQQFSTQQTQPQQFDVPELQTVAPVTQTRQPTHATEPVTHTRQPSTYTTQQAKTQRFRNPQHEASKSTQQLQDHQFRRFPEDYQKQTEDGSNLSQVPNVDTKTQNHGLRQNQQQYWSNQNIPNNKFEQDTSKFQSDHHSVSSIAPPVTTLPPLQTTLAPNQPPLSVYMETTEDTKVNDVLRLLKNAKSIQVLDTIGPDSPQVFVGPSNLNAPDGYIKFELPYLNSLESNRVERKVDKLPFFVAPLNFNPPPGYSKIPFPAPHIGSVVVSNDTVLRTALHEKPFFNEPAPASASEKYLDQYTLPAQIAPISPQLPSLINSLQDEIFSGSSTPTYSTTTELPTTTAAIYTTPSYRGRGSSRGSHRASSSYTTPASQSRRPQSRTRKPYDGRPYSRRQPVTTPTTTLEPSTEAPTQQYTLQQEQVAFNSEDYSVHNTAAPIHTQTPNNAATLQPANTGTYYNERFVSSGLNENQFSAQQLTEQPTGNQNFHQDELLNNGPNVQQYQQTQNNYNSQGTAHTTAIPTVAVPEVQNEDQAFRSQRPSGSRKDSLRQHQRFRGRQRLTTTTTTENYEEPAEPTQDRFNQQTSSGITYQNVPSRQHLRNHDQSRLVENTHFQANIQPHHIQTERADIGLQTTEKVFPVQNEQQFIQQPVDNVQLKSQINNQFQVPITSQGEDPNINQANLQHQFQIAQEQFSQQNLNPQQSSTKVANQENRFDYIPASQQNTQYTNDNIHQGRFAQQSQNFREHQPQLHQENVGQVVPEGQVPNPVGQTYFDQLNQQNQQETQPAPIVPETHSQHSFNNAQTILSQQGEVEDTQGINQNVQDIPVQTSEQFAQHVTELSPASPQEPLIQTQNSEALQPQVADPQIHQYNQQRLKYNRPHSRTQAAVESSSTGEQTSSRRGQYNFQALENNTPSTSEPATTKAALVRVRGRVRSRQRASTRVTTTETPNYPTNYLNRQRDNAEKEETQEYVPKKRVNYSSRQTFSSLRHNNNKEEDNEQSFTEPNYASTDRQSTAERYSDYTEITTTKPTEAPTNKPQRRYQHILNRNKIRRVRPTSSPSTSGSTGTTKFLLPTTSPPITRLPLSRGRIRKPVNIKTTTTTEYPQANPTWNERDNFAPSAGSNEILEPLYQTKDKSQQTFGFQRTPIAPLIPQKTTPKPVAPVANDDDEDYWNQAVTIQQSTSFDFKPEHAPVTPPSFQENRAQGTFSPIWNGQIELQDGNYYDIFSQQQIAKNAHDQTPFSSDQQKVVYKDIKSRIPVGKENQYTEKTYEGKKQAVTEDEESAQNERIYPVYREINKPDETLQEETSQVVADLYEGDGKGLVHEKDASNLSENSDVRKYEETANLEPESEVKEGALKRKIIATHPGKKGGRRRGSWVRVRVRKPQDMFEAAESQNLASLSENAIQAVTKTVGDKAAPSWTPEPEPVTELPHTTNAPEAVVAEEPVETINFEDALKDMLKEFITNPEEENKEEETEASTSVTNTNVTAVETADSKLKEDDSQAKNENLDTFSADSKVQNEELKSVFEDDIEKKVEEQVKTVLPEVTTEVFTQEPTTIVQTLENVETTIEPEITTTPNEPTHLSRVLGTSTTTEISLETEICYRGRCVKTKKGEPDSDLLTME